MNSNQLLFLSAADVRRALPMPEAVEVMKLAMAALSAGEAVVPLRSHVEVAEHHGRLLLMPCYQRSTDALSLKAVTVFDGNPARGLPRIQALVTLYDGTTGQALAILGAGVQGRTQLEAICAVRAVRTVWVADPLPRAAEIFAREMSAATGLEVVAVATPAAAVRQADIVCAATSARTPVFSDADLKPGTHVNGVGSYQPGMQEIPTETVLRAHVVVDHRESALAEAGDLLVPIQQGCYSADRIAAELGEIVSGRKPGRADAHEITLFKSVGVAIQDLAAASRILANAREMGLGTLLQR